MVISNLNIKLIEDRLGFVNKAIAKLKSQGFVLIAYEQAASF